MVSFLHFWRRFDVMPMLAMLVMGLPARAPACIREAMAERLGLLPNMPAYEGLGLPGTSCKITTKLRIKLIAFDLFFKMGHGHFCIQVIFTLFDIVYLTKGRFESTRNRIKVIQPSSF